MMRRSNVMKMHLLEAHYALKWLQHTNRKAGTRSEEAHHTLRYNTQIWDATQPRAVAEAAYVAVSYMQ